MARIATLVGLCVALGTAPARAESTYCKTRYPIVLAHGAAGFDRLLGGVIEYWNGITSALRGCGAQVFVTSVSAIGSSEERGRELLAQIEQIVATTGAGKVNIIGHSQGGLDARYVLGVRPDLVASVTTVGTPHRGASLADFVVDNLDPDGTIGHAIVSALGDGFGMLIDLLAGTDNPQDAVGAIEALTSAGMAAFNAKYPVGVASGACGQGAPEWNGVRLYSWGGTGVLTNVLDVGDVAFGIASLFYTEASDGLVGRCSSHFGQVLRDDYRMNHLDEVNLFYGLVSWFETSPPTVYRVHGNRLRNAGL
jgi:triacylglycerol lipase